MTMLQEAKTAASWAAGIWGCQENERACTCKRVGNEDKVGKGGNYKLLQQKRKVGLWLKDSELLYYRL